MSRLVSTPFGMINIDFIEKIEYRKTGKGYSTYACLKDGSYEQISEEILHHFEDYPPIPNIHTHLDMVAWYEYEGKAYRWERDIIAWRIGIYGLTPICVDDFENSILKVIRNKKTGICIEQDNRDYKNIEEAEGEARKCALKIQTDRVRKNG